MTLVVELGVSHTGMNAGYPFKYEMDTAIDNGALLLKGQLYEERHIVGNPYYAQVKKAMLTEEQARTLMDYAHERGAELFFTPEDESMVPMCERLGVKYYKVSHAQYGNLGLLHAIVNTNKPTIVSIPWILDAPVPIFHREDWHKFYCHSDYTGRTDLVTLRKFMDTKPDGCRGCSLHDYRMWVNMAGWLMFGSVEVHYARSKELVDAQVAVDGMGLAAMVFQAKLGGVDQRLSGFGRSFE